MKVLEAVIAGLDQHVSGQSRINKKSQKKSCAKRTDKRVFLCPECDTAWQPPFFNNKKADYYDDFPKIGIKNNKKICPKCKQQTGF